MKKAIKEKSKKVIFLNSIPLGDTSTGLPRVSEFCRYLIKNGYDAKAIVSCSKRIKNLEKFITLKELVKLPTSSNKIINHTKRIFNVFLCIPMVVRLIRKEKPDIVVSFDFQFLLSIFIARLFTKRYFVIFDYADPLLERLRATKVNPLVLFFAEKYENLICRSADHIIVTMEHYKKFLHENKKIPNNKITVVEQAIDFDLFGTKNKYEKSDLGLDKKEVFIYSGFIGPWFNIPDFIERSANFLKKHKRVHFLFIGPSHEANLNEAKQKIQSLGLRQSYSFIPPVPRSEIPAWIRAADFGITIVRNDIKNFWDSVPSKTFDYMIEKKPILAFGPKGGELEKYIKKNKIGAFVNNENDFEKAYLFLVKNKKMLAKNEAKLIKKLDYKRTSRKLLKLFDSLTRVKPSNF